MAVTVVTGRESGIPNPLPPSSYRFPVTGNGTLAGTSFSAYPGATSGTQEAASAEPHKRMPSTDNQSSTQTKLINYSST
eukprot:scaffold120045_cov22-Attheya_sp.AAC.1